jgi:hypothetical protein
LQKDLESIDRHERDDVLYHREFIAHSSFRIRNLTRFQYVFAMAGLKGNNVLLSSSIQYVINVAMTVPALIWMDPWGRRPMLLVGAALMMIWLFINAGTFILLDVVLHF